MIMPDKKHLLKTAGTIYTWAEMKELQCGKKWKAILKLMQNRMVMGGFRYVPIVYQKKRELDNIADIRRRLDLYEETGNMEHLLDIANITIIECLKENHPKFHFKSIDDGEHAKRVR